MTVGLAPAITTADSATLTAGSAGSFVIGTAGYPAPTLSETGNLPTGVTFTDDGDGTARLAGTPAASASGTYPITIAAGNGIGSPATQSFTLVVDQAPAITSGNNATFSAGSSGSFTVQTTGLPTPALSESGGLPAGVTFIDNGDGTASLAGTPSAGGSYPFTITAHNGAGQDATQSFTLVVDQSPAITSAAAVTLTTGSAGSFTVQTAGYPTPTLSESGSLPSGLTFADNGDGTARLTGTPRRPPAAATR